MNADVMQITPDMLRQMVDDLVERKRATIFRDPEDDLELSDELKEILARQDERIENGDYGEPLEDIVERLALR